MLENDSVWIPCHILHLVTVTFDQFPSNDTEKNAVIIDGFIYYVPYI